MQDDASMIRLLRPASVALVGASDSPASLGGRTLANLAGYGGRLYLVNPKRREIGGVPCHASIRDLPESVDCVVLAIPEGQTEAVVAQCAAAGVGAVVVLASGYAELATAEGVQAQRRLVEIASAAGMRLVGPNCVGVSNRAHGLNAAFAEFPPSPLVAGRRIGVVSQSGALGLGLSYAAERGVSFSHVLTCGNSSDVDVADYVAFLADDDACDAAALTFEGLPHPGRLTEAVRRFTARGKRIAFCHVGQSEAGRAAVAFHTATPTVGADMRLELADLAGVVEVRSIESLIDTAVFLAKAPAPTAGGVAVLTGSGGTGILAMDAASRFGLATPQPCEATGARLREVIPPFGSARNPCDATAQATRYPDLIPDAAEALLADPRFAALVLPWGRSQSPAVLARIGEIARVARKPACVVWMAQSPVASTLQQVEGDPSLSLFQSLDGCMHALWRWQARVG